MTNSTRSLLYCSIYCAARNATVTQSPSRPYPVTFFRLNLNQFSYQPIITMLRYQIGWCCYLKIPHQYSLRWILSIFAKRPYLVDIRDKYSCLFQSFYCTSGTFEALATGDLFQSSSYGVYILRYISRRGFCSAAESIYYGRRFCKFLLITYANKINQFLSSGITFDYFQNCGCDRTFPI